MKDYNLRSRDIYGDPKPKGWRLLGKLFLLLLIGGLGAAAYWYWNSAPQPPTETETPAGQTTAPDIIPLALPPRRDSPPTPAGDKPTPAAGR